MYATKLRKRGIDSEITIDQENESNDECNDELIDSISENNNCESESVSSVSSDSEPDSSQYQIIEDEDSDWSDECPELIPMDFTKKSGPMFDKLRNPINYFKKMFTQDLFDLIVKETNRYGDEKFAFQHIDQSELEGFLGATMLMSLIIVPQIEHYWSHDKLFGQPSIKSIFQCHRYQQILGSLHLIDNNSPRCDRSSSHFDKLHKVRDMLNILKSNFNTNYTPGCQLSVDEGMIKFKGRSSMKQYIANKPIKRGYKVWKLCDSRNGYVYDFNIYEGKEKAPDSEKKTNLGEKVVMRLCNTLQEKWHQVYFDNFFNSFDLLEKLKSKQLYGCGTIRNNRKGLPVDFPADKNMARGEVAIRHKDGLYAMKWCDNKSVLLASNFYVPGFAMVSRTIKGSNNIDVECPNLIQNYNKYMGGVDLSDRLVQTYARDRQSKKNWHRIFFHFLDLCVVNAFLLYKEHYVNSSSLLRFKKRLADELCQEQRKRHAEKAKRTRIVKTTDSLHILRYVNCYHEHGFSETRRQCWLCWNERNKMNNRTYSMCKTCQVVLCFLPERNCFDLFHKT